MSDLQTNVGIRVINQASEPLSKIGADMKELSDGIKKANTELSGAGSGLQGFGKSAAAASEGGAKFKGVLGGIASEISPFTLGVAGIAAAVVGLGKASLDAAQELQQVGIRAKAVFGSDFAQADAIAQKLADTLRRDKEEVLGMMASFDAMGRGAGIASDQALALSEDMTKVAESLGKILAKTPEQSFDIVKHGLAGMGRGLKEYGIYVDDASMKEYAHAKGIKVKFDELNEGGKTLVRAMYLEEKQLELQGNLGETTMTLREAWIQLKAAVDPYLEAIGMVISVPIGAFLEGMAGGLNVVTGLLRLLGASAKDTAADIYNMGLSVAQFFGIASEAQKASTDNVKEALDSMSQSSSQNMSSMQGDLQQSKAHSNELVAALNSGKYKGSGLSSAAGEAKQLSKAMKALGDDFGKISGDIVQKSKELEMKHNEAMSSMMEKQRDLYARLNDLRTAAGQTAAAFADIGVKFKQTMADLNTDSITSVGEQLQKIKDLTNDVKKAQLNDPTALSTDQIVSRIANRTDKTSLTLSAEDARGLSSAQEEQVNKTMQLHREQKAYTEYLQKALNLNKEIVETIREGSKDYIKNAEKLVTGDPNLGKGIALAGQTDFAKTQANITKQAQEAQRQMDKDTEKNKQDQERNAQEQAKVKADLDALEKKRQVTEKAYQLERAEISYTKAALDAYHTQYVQQMNDMATVTQTTVENVKKQLEALRTALSQAQTDAQYAAQATANLSSSRTAKPKFAAGGVVGSQAGGVDVTVAEGMYNEAIVPLPDGRSIPVRIEGSGGQGNQITVNLGGVTIKNDMDVQQMVRTITTAIDNQLLKAR